MDGIIRVLEEVQEENPPISNRIRYNQCGDCMVDKQPGALKNCEECYSTICHVCIMDNLYIRLNPKRLLCMNCGIKEQLKNAHNN